MRNIAPKKAILFIKFKSRTQTFFLDFYPKLTKFFQGNFALFSLIMNIFFKFKKGDLPYNRVDHILNFSGSDEFLFLRIFLIFKNFLESQLLAKNRCSFSQSQRSSGHEVALFFCQILVNTMSKLMRQSHNIAHFALIIHQNIWMN